MSEPRDDYAARDRVSPTHVNDRFPVLSFISAFLRVIGWLIVPGGIISIAVAAAKAFQAQTLGWWDVAPIFFSLFITAAGALIVATGESIGVLFAIEANTRLSAERLSRQAPLTFTPPDR